MVESAVQWVLTTLAAPEVGLLSVFIISFVSATLLPLGSEPAVFAVVKANIAPVSYTHLTLPTTPYV